MFLAAPVTPFEWQRIFFSDNAPLLFLLEIVLRCVVMYLLTLAVLRVTGRRGVRQLSIFELSIILALGSAAGDAMIYEDTPLGHAALVFGVVGVLYRFFNWLTEKFPRFSDWLEGKPVLLVKDGIIQLDNFNHQNLTQKELFGEMRQRQVEHLGQVSRVYVEATGNFSIYFFEDDQVRPGMPIWPERLGHIRRRAEVAGQHACARCGHTQELARGEVATCPICQNDEWLTACETLRIG